MCQDSKYVKAALWSWEYEKKKLDYTDEANLATVFNTKKKNKKKGGGEQVIYKGEGTVGKPRMILQGCYICSKARAFIKLILYVYSDSYLYQRWH